MNKFYRNNFNDEDFRNEVKYKFYTQSLSSWVDKIRKKQNNFITHHKARWVNNIYYDSLSMDLFKQSHEGSSPRTKIRLRWYGDFFDSNINCNLELKIKFSNKNTKVSYAIPKTSILPNLRINKINHKLNFNKNLPLDITRMLYSIVPFPVIFIRTVVATVFVFLFSASGISLILYSLNSNLDYFFTPTEIKQRDIPSEKRIKLGGMVLEGSVKRNANEIFFTITDYENSITVVFSGIVPDLFKEGSGVVALGFMENEIFYAKEVLAKHDENYMPPNLDIKNDS